MNTEINNKKVSSQFNFTFLTRFYFPFRLLKNSHPAKEESHWIKIL